jgi:multicomponent Na+:H+ antiporter subunit D
MSPTPADPVPVHLVVAPMLAALGAAVSTTLTRRWPRLQRGLSLLGGLAYLGLVGLLARAVSDGGTLSYQLSAWRPPFGIVLVADALAVFMLVIAAVVGLAALVYSVFALDEFAQRVSYHPLFHFMLVGVSGAFLTGDIFNLFVWFEVMLMPSYVLVVFYSGAEHTRAGLQYVVLNLVGSAVMLVAIGGLYATSGTLNMADIARRLTDPAAPAIDPLPVLGLSAILLSVFALKAGIVPFQFWVPAAYRAAPAPVTAFLAGVTKKVGVYAIVRLVFTVLGGATLADPIALPGFGGASFLDYFGPVLFLMAAASILLGGVGAVTRDDLDGVLAYSSIGQVGFIVLPLAVAATAEGPVRVVGLVAALVYTLNHALAKSALFLLSGAIYDRTGTRDLDSLGGLAGGAPVLAAGFFVAALALVGIPPLSGFFSKLFVFQTAIEAGVAGAAAAWLALAVAHAGAVLTLAYITRGWNRAVWGEATSVIAGPTRSRRGLAVVPLVLAAAIVLVGVGFEPVYRAARAAATAALDRSGYVDAVDPGVVG